MIDLIRKQLRISTTDLDDEIKQLIQTCLVDLRTSGLNVPAYDGRRLGYGNALVDSCIILWCKAYFGLEVNEKAKQCYFELKNTLIMGGINE